MINEELVKRAFGIPSENRISISRVSSGWNIRIKKAEKKKVHKKNKEEMVVTQCRKCGRVTYCHYHHIIPISAGGGDEMKNKLPLCFDDHVGDNGIHDGKWKIEEIVDHFQLTELKKEYGIL